MLDAALALHKAGIRPLPIIEGTKRPQIEWQGDAAVMPTEEQVRHQFRNGVWLGAQTGAVSGNLECIDFDDPDCFEPWCEIVKAYGLAEVLEKCYVQSTPRLGFHVVYRAELAVPGNLKLAFKYGENGEKKGRIETRGDGGQFLVYPSKGYKTLHGEWSKMPVIGASARGRFIEAARTFDLCPKRPYVTQGTGVAKPGKDFDSRVSWDDVIVPAGWRETHRKGDERFWCRPGKAEGISATTGYAGTDLLYVFSTNAAPFEAGATYSKFAAYAFLHHGGNFVEAARELGRNGYGDQTERPAQRTYVPPAPVQDAPDRAVQRWLRAAEVKEQKIDWLWNLYVPIGEVTMIVGNPGDGKSTLAQAIVTAVTLGTELFGDRVAQGSAVFLSAEQSVATVTVPRFRRMGADLSKIILPDEVNDQDEPVPFVLDKSGMAELRAVCLAERPKVVVIDTVTAYIEASRDFNSANQTREWMRGLAEIARTTPCAVVLLGHLNKNSSAHPLMRILGSIDFVGASRSVLLVGKDPDEQDTRGLAQIKSNVGPFGEPRGFRLDGDEFSWTDGSRLDAARMLQPAAIQAAETTKERCERWMRGLFKDTNTVEAPEEEYGKIGGFTAYMVTATKKKLGIVSVKDGIVGWIWKWGDDHVYRGGD